MDPTNLQALFSGDMRMLAKAISQVENETEGYEYLIEKAVSQERGHPVQIIGITGPPGAGKSTLIDGLLSVWAARNIKTAILAVDPSSPFHKGALLGDRFRMHGQYDYPGVFIRSLASRGSLGGLHPKIIEISMLVQAAGFEKLIIETVGVGQSEVEIATLADTTVVVLAPESGDDIQSMKAGLMEIADVFVLNKADRPGASKAAKHLRDMVKQKGKTGWAIPVIQTIATEKKEIGHLASHLEDHFQQIRQHPAQKAALWAEKAWQLIAARRMKEIDKKTLQQQIETALQQNRFNILEFVKGY